LESNKRSKSQPQVSNAKYTHLHSHKRRSQVDCFGMKYMKTIASAERRSYVLCLAL